MALKALQLDPNLSEAHLALGKVLFFGEIDVAGALREYKRAIELKPNDADAHHWYGNDTLSALGRFDEAIAEGRRSVELDPLSMVINVDLGVTFFYARRYDESAATETPILTEESVAELSGAARNRLEALREKLLADDARPRLVERLIEFIERGDDFSLLRIRPYALADDWKESRRMVLETCLRATRAGLLDLKWDLVCPLCRGPQESETSLREISSKVHCETCKIDFTVNFDRYVEVTFRPNALVRHVDVKDYCMGSPQRTPHVIIQQLLPARTSRTLTLPLDEGRYRLRTLELPGTIEPASVAIDYRNGMLLVHLNTETEK